MLRMGLVKSGKRQVKEVLGENIETLFNLDNALVGPAFQRACLAMVGCSR